MSKPLPSWDESILLHIDMQRRFAAGWGVDTQAYLKTARGIDQMCVSARTVGVPVIGVVARDRGATAAALDSAVVVANYAESSEGLDTDGMLVTPELTDHFFSKVTFSNCAHGGNRLLERVLSHYPARRNMIVSGCFLGNNQCLDQSLFDMSLYFPEMHFWVMTDRCIRIGELAEARKRFAHRPNIHFITSADIPLPAPASRRAVARHFGAAQL